MTDSYLTEFWAQAPWPWNEYGPKIAERIKLGIVPALPPSKPSVWARQLREARKASGLTQAAVARHCGLSVNRVHMIETDRASEYQGGWAKLATFYGITLE
jgi:DNA-binding XRE family transcriptional regulator